MPLAADHSTSRQMHRHSWRHSAYGSDRPQAGHSARLGRRRRAPTTSPKPVRRRRLPAQISTAGPPFARPSAGRSSVFRRRCPTNRARWGESRGRGRCRTACRANWPQRPQAGPVLITSRGQSGFREHQVDHFQTYCISAGSQAMSSMFLDNRCPWCPKSPAAARDGKQDAFALRKDDRGGMANAHGRSPGARPWSSAIAPGFGESITPRASGVDDRVAREFHCRRLGLMYPSAPMLALPLGALEPAVVLQHRPWRDAERSVSITSRRRSSVRRSSDRPFESSPRQARHQRGRLAVSSDSLRPRLRPPQSRS